jgi:hypothetical protein
MPLQVYHLFPAAVSRAARMSAGDEIIGDHGQEEGDEAQEDGPEVYEITHDAPSTGPAGNDTLGITGARW